MKRIIILYTLLFLGFSASWAQEANDSTKKKQKELYLLLPVADHLTHQGLDSIWGFLRNASDSTIVDTLKMDKYEYGGKVTTNAYTTVKQPGNYFFDINAEGYDSKTVPFDLPKLYKREQYRTLKTCYLRQAKKPLEHDLDEVVVTATKLKFYMDGDTLVYNADAFSMAEGSMLGELVRKLPGVELKSGGEITVNGKKVESLLLNGKDFFDSDRELMLENMPTYMVSKIQTYERVPVDVRGTNREKTTPKEMVMNVKLKRNYNTGWLANAEVGVSPANIYSETDKNTSFDNSNTKYLGRLFALRFDDKSRLNLYASANNLNDKRTPGESGDWSPAAQSRDISKVYTAGGSYVYGSWEKFRYAGSANVTYTDTQAASHTASQTFLEGGDQYGRSFSSSNNNNLSVKVENEISDRKESLSWAKYFNTNANVRFNYEKWDNSGESANATFMKDVATELGKEWIDSIKAPDGGDVLRRYAVNRILSQTKGVGHNTNVSTNGYVNIAPPHNDMLDINIFLDGSYTDRSDDSYNHYLLEYPMGGAATDFRNRYNPSFNNSYNFSVRPQVSITLDSENHNILNISDTYVYSFNRSNNDLYLLNHLQGWDNNSNHTLGMLPSEAELLSTLDADNSTHATEYTHYTAPRFTYQYTAFKENEFTLLGVTLDLPAEFKRLDYWQGTQADTTIHRNTVFLQPYVMFMKQNYSAGKDIMAQYSYTTSAPSITSLLDIHNTSDPLNIRLSNPNLKNTHTHFFLSSYRNKFGRTLFNANVNANITQNAVAYGYILDRSTGMRTTTPENVNGNWNANVNSGVDFPLTKNEKWRMTEGVSYSYNHSVDLSGVDGALKASRSVVGSHGINNEWQLNWRPSDKMEFAAKSNVNYQHSTSDRVGFQTINAFDFNYGALGQMELPWDMQLSTDITMYSRRGYNASEMNTNELVWNARLTKRLMHGNLLVQFDALDMLGQLSNVSRYINAQGKTETFYNVMPSYLLLHVAWRLNKKPKKEK